VEEVVVAAVVVVAMLLVLVVAAWVMEVEAPSSEPPKSRRPPTEATMRVAATAPATATERLGTAADSSPGAARDAASLSGLLSRAGLAAGGVRRRTA